MDKKAFTLIELLVVIAIIAILAAILFPVFAQAKTAAKKSASISNVKQINTGLFLYQSDYDDIYPRNDDCVPNSSLDPKYNDASANPSQAELVSRCNAFNNLGGFAWRMNHYAWQKWVMPYIKSTSLFLHPSYALIKGTNMSGGVPTNFDQGEIANGYALNIALTGALNTWPTPSANAAYRNSFVGGTQNGIPDPASAMLMTEQWFFPITGALSVPATGQTVTAYPPAFKEHWAAMFYKNGGAGACGVQDGQIDSTKVPFGVVPVGYADGHTKAVSVGKFLADTPTYSQFTGAPLSTAACAPFASHYNTAVNSLTLPPTGTWPFWGM